jgi:hypothetical protein
MLKDLKKLRIEGMFLNIIKAIYDKPRVNTILNEEQLKPFSLKSGMRQGCPFTPLLFNMVLEFLARAISQKQEIKGIHIGKEKVKLYLFVDDIILYLRNPKNSTKKKILEIINSFGKVAEYKININKSVAFLYPNNKQTEKEIRETIPFTIASKTIKYLGINLMKETKDFFSSSFYFIIFTFTYMCIHCLCHLPTPSKPPPPFTPTSRENLFCPLLQFC